MNFIKNKNISSTLKLLSNEQVSLLIRKYIQNAFNMDNNKIEIKPCILFYGAIFNHSCNPNVSFKFDSKSKTMIFYSNQKINKNIIR